MRIEGANRTTDYNTQDKIQMPIKQPVAEIKLESDQPRAVEPVTGKTDVDLPIEDKVKDYPEYVPTIAEKTIINAIEAANKKLEGINTEFRFSIHESTKQIMVKVLNKDTGEVVREIPPEKTLDMVAKMWEMSGIFVDERG